MNIINLLPKNLKTFLLFTFIFFIIIFLVTNGLLNGFFEQDEWKGFSDVLYSYNRSWWEIFIPAQIHFAPLGIFIWNTLYKIFKFNAEYYFIFGLLIHSATSALVFIFTERLTKNKSVALLASLLFLLNGRAHQAFTHIAIFHSSTLAMFFIMLFFTYLSGIKENILNLKKTFILFFIFLFAIFTREEGFMIIPIMAVYLFCFDKSKINRSNLKYFLFFLAGFILFISTRYLAQSLYKDPIPVQYQITGSGAEYNLLTIPIKLFVQNIIYSERIAVFWIVNLNKVYPTLESYFISQPALMDAAFFYIATFMAVIIGIWLWLFKLKKIWFLILFLSVWICANAFMLSFVGRHLNVLEPRYLYYSAFPVFCFLAVFLHSVFTAKSNYGFINHLRKLIVVFVILVLFVTSYQEIRVAVENMSRSGKVKKELIKNLLIVHPSIDKNTVFFVKCKNVCSKNVEYGIPNENVLPFSSGPGMNFLVYYASIQGEEREWGPFLTKHFLFHIYSEDYKRIGDRSFGYYISKEKLENSIVVNKINKEDIVALEYNESNHTFNNISKDFIKTLK